MNQNIAECTLIEEGVFEYEVRLLKITKENNWKLS